MQIDFDTSVDLKFYCDQLETGNISLASGNKEIKRILSYNPSSKLPTNWRSAKAKVESYVENFKLLTHLVPFPAEWDISNNIPLVRIQVRDVLDIVSCILADPKLQSSNEFYLDTKNRAGYTKKEKGKCDHIMSSSWALSSKDMIDKIDPKGIFIPIILYEDGITVDSAGVRNIDRIVLTLGNFSKKLRNCDASKYHVGFVPKIQKSSIILDHLRSKFGKTRGHDAFKFFKLKIHRDMYRLILSTLKQISSTGSYLIHSLHFYIL